MNEPIDLVAIFDKEGKITPYQFKYQDKRIKNINIVKRYEDKRAGNLMIGFRCLFRENGFYYNLLYEVGTHKWFIKIEK